MSKASQGREEWQAKRNADEARAAHARALVLVAELRALAVSVLYVDGVKRANDMLDDFMGDTFSPHLTKSEADENESRIGD